MTLEKMFGLTLHNWSLIKPMSDDAAGISIFYIQSMILG